MEEKELDAGNKVVTCEVTTQRPDGEVGGGRAREPLVGDSR